MDMKRLSAALIVACAAPAAVAGMNEFVVPPAYENTPGTTSFTGPLAVGGRTYQLLVHESLLTDLVGLEIDGLSWRLPANATAPWPATDTLYSNYDIYLSGSVAPSDRSLTFADNIVGTQTQVRSGPLSILAGDYPSGSSPNDWGAKIGFSSGYTYNGGHLLVEIRHNGSNTGSRANDAIGTAIAGYGTLFSAAWQSSYTATTGLQGNFSIFRFTAVPAPSAAGVLGLGLMAGLRRRR